VRREGDAARCCRGEDTAARVGDAGRATAFPALLLGCACDAAAALAPAPETPAQEKRAPFSLRSSARHAMDTVRHLCTCDWTLA
jgi:hypothetical protein